MFKPGDKVHWTQTSARGRTLTMTRREGVIVALSLAGDLADVRLPGGKQVQLYTKILRKDGQRGQIEDFIDVVREANRSA